MQIPRFRALLIAAVFFYVYTAVASAEPPHPETSVVDFLKARGLKSDRSDRKNLYGKLFPKEANAYTGSESQNVKLLAALKRHPDLTKSTETVERLSARSRTGSPLLIGLIGGFGWSSWSSKSSDFNSHPDLWDFEPKACLLAEHISGFVGPIDAANCLRFPRHWDQGESLAEQLIEQVAKHRGGSIVLVGHSFGGSGAIDTALALEKKKGPRVALLVLIDPVNNNASRGEFVSKSFSNLPSNVDSLALIQASEAAVFPNTAVPRRQSMLKFKIQGTTHTEVDGDSATQGVIDELLKRVTPGKPLVFADADLKSLKGEWVQRVTFEMVNP